MRKRCLLIFPIIGVMLLSACKASTPYSKMQVKSIAKKLYDGTVDYKSKEKVSTEDEISNKVDYKFHSDRGFDFTMTSYVRDIRTEDYSLNVLESDYNYQLGEYYEEDIKELVSQYDLDYRVNGYTGGIAVVITLDDDAEEVANLLSEIANLIYEDAAPKSEYEDGIMMHVISTVKENDGNGIIADIGYPDEIMEMSSEELISYIR